AFVDGPGDLIFGCVDGRAEERNGGHLPRVAARGFLAAGAGAILDKMGMGRNPPVHRRKRRGEQLAPPLPLLRLPRPLQVTRRPASSRTMRAPCSRTFSTSSEVTALRMLRIFREASSKPRTSISISKLMATPPGIGTPAPAGAHPGPLGRR